MTLGRVHTRIFIGVAAWLLGVVGATGGSLLAVSLLGQGILASPSQQLTVSAVNRALASETAETPAAARVSRAQPTPATRRRAARDSRQVHHRPVIPPPSPEPMGTPGSVFSSLGGTVVARCGPGGVYLVTWSPQQGYEVTGVFRGPAPEVAVTFTSGRQDVKMTMTCTAGVPSETTTTGGSWGDD